jgi:hypothetical protein
MIICVRTAGTRGGTGAILPVAPSVRVQTSTKKRTIFGKVNTKRNKQRVEKAGMWDGRAR